MPLLGKQAAPPPPPLLNRFQRFLITFFSVFRIVRGLGFMAWPALGLSSFDIPRSGATFLLGSLLGSRDLLLGGLLWSADLHNAREVRRALLVNLLSDAMDTFILIFSAAASWHWRNPLVEIGIAATLAIMEHLTLWSMDEDEGQGAREYQAHMQAGEDKKRRLDTWLSELRQVEAQTQRPASTVAGESAAAA